jgi:hypothetical protein
LIQIEKNNNTSANNFDYVIRNYSGVNTSLAVFIRTRKKNITSKSLLPTDFEYFNQTPSAK